MKWQPIETAPTDGTSVLCLSKEGVWQSSWDDLYVEDYGILAGFQPLIIKEFHGCGCCGTNPLRATHWMPLPEEPNE